MKYSLQITINKPIDEVVSKFDNIDNIYKWMEGLKSFEHLEGTLGEVGAKSRMVFKMDKREIVMIETITKKDLPNNFEGTYEADGVYNIVGNQFKRIDEKTTLYISNQEFQFKGFMKLIGFIMPGAFKKQSLKIMNNFKNFVESTT